MKKFFTAAVISAAILTGCTDYGDKIPKVYKDYFEYTFDGEYTSSEFDRLSFDDMGMVLWNIYYTDSRGNMLSEAIWGKGLGESEKEKFGTKTVMNDYYAADAMLNFAGDAACVEMLSEVVEPVSDIHGENVVFSGGSVIIRSGDMSGRLKIQRAGGADSLSPAERSAMLDPETGLKIAGYTLKQAAADESRYVQLYLRCSSEDELTSAAEIIDAVLEKYLEYTGKPANYSFMAILTDEESQKGHIAYDCSEILGQTVTPDHGEKFDPAFGTPYEKLISETIGIQ